MYVRIRYAVVDFDMESLKSEHLSPRHEQWLRTGLYVMQLIVVLGLAWRTMVAPQLTHASVATWQYIFDGIVFCVLIIGLLLRHSVRGLWELIAALWVIPAVWFACFLVFPYEIALGAASIITLCGLVIRMPAFQWMMCAIGVAGVAMHLGTAFPPDFLLLALVAWGAYDMLFPPVQIRWIQKLPGTSFQLPGHPQNLMLMPADVVIPMSLVVYAFAVKSLWGLLIGGGIVLAAVVVLLFPVSRRQLTVGVLAAGAVVPFTILRLGGVL